MKQTFIAFTAFLLCISSLPAKAQSLYYPPILGSTWDTTSAATLGWCQDKLDSLVTYLGNHNTKAFMLLENGKIVVEHYYGTFTVDSPWQWNSAGKSLTGFLTGLAQEQGYINIHDSMPKYLHNGFSSCTHANEDSIRIVNELSMTTGFNDDFGSVPNNPCWADSCLVCIATPGTRWAYHNAPYTLIHHIIDSATGLAYNTFSHNNLASSTGITGSWQIPAGNPYDEIFFSKARSMARFGLLILGKGKWNTTTIMSDTTYFHQMLNTSQSINLSYGYLWWLNGKASYHLPDLQYQFTSMLEPHAPSDMVAALGKNDQILNVVPSMGIVLVRMGDAIDSSLEVSIKPNDTMWILLNAAFCGHPPAAVPNAVGNMQNTNAVVQVFPNPAQQTLFVKLDNEQFDVSVTDMTGRTVLTANHNFNTAEINCSQLTPGIYFIRTVNSRQQVFYTKAIISGK